MKKIIDIIDIDLLNKLVSNGLTIKEISNELDISISTTKRTMYKFGIKSNLYNSRSEFIRCLECNAEFRGLISNERKFCSSSCSAKYNNIRKIKKEKEPTLNNNKRIRVYKIINHGKCLNCDSDIIKNDGRVAKYKYCSQDCLREFQLNKRINSGEASNKTSKLYLIKKHGEKCMDCGWDKRHSVTNKVPIELEHIDGNSENNNLDNLKLLCPNCHSLTPTYKALNVGNGRHSRRERYKEGKSF